MDLLKIQTIEYQNFIKKLIAGGQILSKSFFVVVPFTFIEIPGFKLRVGDYRLLVDVDFSNKELTIQVLRHRRDIYKNL